MLRIACKNSQDLKIHQLGETKYDVGILYNSLNNELELYILIEINIDLKICHVKTELQSFNYSIFVLFCILDLYFSHKI